ncbi:hypothetical protein IVG45_03165 [Methylomonas sp. LL1]|uniref:hypothetical protein n=1 Tax=Methylomonas sp. LL1 TaxID=2785785 RepID=UPI0018C38476|nr:hypothetical protein [Methylomonas sp. LL1]QPK63994.1 hypothetical protein IVG45_03165 [Methylomonas sp. LL1]CAG1022421.1 hypothetical protein MTYM_01709 [Methylococcales bacterium]
MKKLLLSILAIILIIEEWLWDALSAFGHVLIRLLHLEVVERWLSQASPHVALMAFTIPLLIVTPINLAAFALLAHGLILQGVLLEIVAKLLGTLLVSRVFALTKPQLLTFRVLAFVYATIRRWLRWAHQKITETKVYKIAKALKAEVKQRFAAWFKSIKHHAND